MNEMRRIGNRDSRDKVGVCPKCPDRDSRDKVTFCPNRDKRDTASCVCPDRDISDTTSCVRNGTDKLAVSEMGQTATPLKGGISSLSGFSLAGGVAAFASAAAPPQPEQWVYARDDCAIA